MKKIVVICISVFLCAFAQDDDGLHIIQDTPEVYSFKGGNVEKTVVAHWYEDTQNLTTVVENPAQRSFWAVSHGGFLGHPVIDLLDIGVSIAWQGQQKDEEKLLPMYIYKIFAPTDENYDSILKTDWSFINLLAMEITEIAEKRLLDYIDTTEQDSLVLSIDFIGISYQKRIELLNSFNMTLDSIEKRYMDIGGSNQYIYYWEYFIGANKNQVLPLINSGAVTKVSFYSASSSSSIGSAGGGKTIKNFKAVIANNTIRFSQKLPNNSAINIYAPNGKIVYSSKISGNSHKLPNIAKGVYLLKIVGADKSIILNQKIAL